MPWVAVLIFAVTCALGLAFGRNQRSGWNLVTFPGEPCTARNPLLGYNSLWGSQPFMKENIAAVRQLAWYSGSQVAWYPEASDQAGGLGPIRQEFRFLRGLYPFLAALVAPFWGAISALLVVNCLAWGCCAWVTWQLSMRLFADRLAALLSTILVSGGMIVVHIDDFGPHVLSFATYYLGVYLLYASGVFQETRPWRTHLLLGLYMAVAALAYNTGIMLVAAYLLVSFRRNRWLHLFGAAAIALSVRPIWYGTLCALLGSGVYDREAVLLGEALLDWWNLLRGPWTQLAVTVLHRLSQFILFCESPLVVLLGIPCCLLLPGNRNRVWFGIVIMAMPVFTSFVYTSSPIVTARGYVAYGGTVWIFCWLGSLLAKGLRRPPVRLLSALCVLLVFSSHFAWSTAHMWGWLGPVKTFLFGWDSGWPYVTYPWTDVASTTGYEKIPIYFGGDASLVEAGAYVTEPDVPVDPQQVSFWDACATRLLPFALLLALGMVYVNTVRKRRTLLAAVAAAVLLSSGLSWATFRTTQVFGEVQRAFVMPPSAGLHYRAILSAEFLNQLAARRDPDDDLAVHLLFPGCSPGDGEIDVVVTAGSTGLPVVWRDTAWVFQDPQRALEAMASSGEIRLEVINRAGKNFRVAGWLRRDRPGREFSLIGPDGSQLAMPKVLPAVELRLLRSDGRLKMAGF